MEVVELKRSVFLRLVINMTDRFLEQRINVKFGVKSRKNEKNYHGIWSMVLSI
jgi:hypothetical protein